MIFAGAKYAGSSTLLKLLRCSTRSKWKARLARLDQLRNINEGTVESQGRAWSVMSSSAPAQHMCKCTSADHTYVCMHVHTLTGGEGGGGGGLGASSVVEVK